MNSFDTQLQAEDVYSDYYPTNEDIEAMKKADERTMAFNEVSDRIDQSRAVRIRGEYGRVGWLLSWEQDENTDMWVARVSCPSLDETIEGIGQTRCAAIDQATRFILEELWKSQSQPTFQE